MESLSLWVPRLIGGGKGEVDGAESRSRDGLGQEVWVETVGSQLANHGTEESCGIAWPGAEAIGRLEKLVASICVMASRMCVGLNLDTLCVKTGHSSISRS